MKPTQEQVIAWEKQAAEESDEPYAVRLAALAYEAGRKDENEACAVRVSEVDADGWEVNMAAIIRARGQG